MLLSIVRTIAIVATGLYAGIIFGDRLGATYSRLALAPSGFVQFQQIQHVHFKPVLMPLTLVAVVASLAWVVLSWSERRKLHFWLAAAGATAMVLAFAVTRIVNFPINDALMTWSAAAPPSNIRELWAPWEHAHSLRAATSVAAFALQVIALSVRAR